MRCCHRDYWLEARPEGWLFPGKPKINPLSPRQLNRVSLTAKLMAGIHKPATLHALHHSLATHLLETNTDVRAIYYPAVAACSDERASFARPFQAENDGALYVCRHEDNPQYGQPLRGAQDVTGSYAPAGAGVTLGAGVSTEAGDC